MGISLNLKPITAGDEQSLSPADLWDKKVAEGMSPDSATAYVSKLHGAPPTPLSRVPGVVSESTAARPGANVVPSSRTPVQFTKDLGRAAAQGATFGYSDEAIAGIRSLLTDQTYANAVADERQALDQFRADHPVIATGAELGGALVGGGAVGAGARALGFGAKAVEGGTAIGRLLRTAGTGMAGGAAAGAGAADDGNRLRGAVGGALWGGGLAAGLGATGIAARAIGKPLGTGLLKLTNTRPQSEESALVRLTAKAGSPVQTVDQMAEQDVLRALDRSGKSLDDVAAARSATELPMTVMDFGDENVQELARRTHDTPGSGRQLLRDRLEQRAAAQPTRVREALEGGIGSERQNVVQLADDLATQRAKEGNALYEQAFAHGAVDDPEINTLLQKPYFAPAWKQALKLAEAEGHDLPAAFKITRVPGKLLDESGTPIMRDVLERADDIPDVRTLHYLKLGLDDVVDRGMSAPLERGGFSPTESAAIGKLQRQFVNRLKTIVPDYKTAADAWAGRTQVMKALDAGRSFLTTARDRVETDMGALSPSEQEFYRHGALNALEERLGSVTEGRDVTSMFRNPEMQNKMRALFGTPDAFDEFLSTSVRPEHAMSRTANYVLNGSRTAPSLAGLAEDMDISPAAMASAATGNPSGVLMSLLNSTVKRGINAQNELRSAARAPLLTAGTGGLDEFNAAMDRLRRARQQMSERAMAPVRLRLPASSILAGLEVGGSR